MYKNEYIAQVTPDGNLSLPSEFASRLNLKVNSKIKVLLIPEQKNKAAKIAEIEKEIDVGNRSPISPRSHEEIFDNIRNKHASR
ncbi:MAG: hypothetical protein JRJ49_11245 [Deltaproteobacteria bacterium]|nr:hypothetical protein [Deltaproteobacteria bacterium]